MIPTGNAERGMRNYPDINKILFNTKPNPEVFILTSNRGENFCGISTELLDLF